MLRLCDIRKSFGSKNVLNGVSFEAEMGEVVGLLGLNGAGKTTLMRIMTGFLPPDSGTVKLDDCDLGRQPELFKSQIGYLPEQAPAYGEMRVTEFLNFMAAARGVAVCRRKDAIERVIELCRLKDVRGTLVGNLSKGYRHRLGLAQAVINDPKLLILDEPTDGLDPQQKNEAREMIAQLGQSRVVIVSTHILEEVRLMCSRTVVLENGVVATKPAFNWNV